MAERLLKGGEMKTELEKIAKQHQEEHEILEQVLKYKQLLRKLE